MLKFTSVALLLIGVICIAISLRKAMLLAKHDNSISSKILMVLLYFFIVAYLTLIYLNLHDTPLPYIEIFTSAIMVLGGLFVLIVINITSDSIDRIIKSQMAFMQKDSYDDLTQIPNRKFFYRQAVDFLNRSLNESLDGFTLVVMDLDHFKGVNGVLGHHIGDLLLKNVANRLNMLEIEGSFLARIGGDEFALLLPYTDRKKIGDAIDLIHKAMDPPYRIEGHTLNVSLSPGVAMYSEHGMNIDDLLMHADSAMYTAKQKQTPYSVYDSRTSATTYHQLELQVMLQNALQTMPFKLYYQPILDLNNQEEFCLEALIRWPNEGGKFIPPELFIPLAEKTDAIRKISRWVLENAIRDLADWVNLPFCPNMNINLSARDLDDHTLPDYINDLLAKYNVPPSKLTLELTETTMMSNPERARPLVNRLRQIGIAIAIDDFGTGFSSLSILSEFPISEIKIDRSFIYELEKSPNHQTIVRSTVFLAHGLGCKVVAEGVESEEIAQILQEFDCDKIQGYHLCNPLDKEDLNTWMNDFTRHSLVNISDKLQEKKTKHFNNISPLPILTTSKSPTQGIIKEPKKNH
ncbi:bifunctional diguanylate cyclase/phosphodiesterase [Parasalinivibrio latis]|uniref:putative bifunctional diguanylate cyclase/phosphodiesterase n=1 Tax=Parasalinivibrio latis TaxID=2952610 RepID=UPI0030E1EE84